MEKTIEIPEGYEARIEGNKVILELKESEDERIPRLLHKLLCAEVTAGQFEKHGLTVDDALYWLERQKEQKPTAEDEKDFLEKEVKAFLCNYDKEFDDDAPTYDIAEHFYQLGKNSQKPAEKQDYSGLTDGVENVPVSIIKDTAQDCLAQIKPAEWSEKDEKMFNSLCTVLHGGLSSIPTEQFIYWLESLRDNYKK